MPGCWPQRCVTAFGQPGRAARGVRPTAGATRGYGLIGIRINPPCRRSIPGPRPIRPSPVPAAWATVRPLPVPPVPAAPAVPEPPTALDHCSAPRVPGQGGRCRPPRRATDPDRRESTGGMWGSTTCGDLQQVGRVPHARKPRTCRGHRGCRHRRGTGIRTIPPRQRPCSAGSPACAAGAPTRCACRAGGCRCAAGRWPLRRRTRRRCGAAAPAGQPLRG